MSQLESEIAGADVYAAYAEGDDIPGGFPLSVHSNGYEASHVVKSGAGRLFGFTGYTSRSSAQFIQLFDSPTLPADGAVPVLFFTVAAASNFSEYWGSVGRWFLYGIVICNSSTGPTKTIGSADCFFDVQFV